MAQPKYSPLTISGDKLCPQVHGNYDYYVQRVECANIGVERALTPVCPPGDGGYPWELVSQALSNNTVIYVWKRYKG